MRDYRIEIEVDDFKVELTYGDYRGIEVTEDHDLTDPRFITALRQMQSYIPALNAVSHLEWIALYVEPEHFTQKRTRRNPLTDHYQEIVDCIAAIKAYPFVADFMDEGAKGLFDAMELEKSQAATVIPAPVNAKPNVFDKPGYVYVLQSDSGFYKIGRTVNPHNRLKTFEVKLPFVVDYTLVIESEAHIKLERDLHQRFSDKRKAGEWFALCPLDIEALRQEYKDHLVSDFETELARARELNQKQD